MPQGIYKRKPFSKEHIEKIRLSHVGKKPMLGKKHSIETKDKIRKAKLGTKISDDTKRKMSESQKRIGNKPPSAKGRKPSKETLEKMRISRLGNKSNLWMGGKTQLTSLIRECYKYHEWRTRVYKRDDFTCVWCGQVGGKIQADHLIPFSKLLDLMLDKHNARELDKYTQLEIAQQFEQLWDINNGRTLCQECHSITDTYGRKKKK